MKVSGGYLQGREIKFAKGMDARPTTNLARLALFNILEHKYDLENKKSLELFCGTALISFEFVSRGITDSTVVDLSFKAIDAARKNAAELKVGEMKFVKDNAFSFLKNCNESFDFIFADPPYHLPNIPEIAERVFERNLLRDGGLLIVEHPARVNLENEFMLEKRVYGQSAFTFFGR